MVLRLSLVSQVMSLGLFALLLFPVCVLLLCGDVVVVSAGACVIVVSGVVVGTQINIDQ